MSPTHPLLLPTHTCNHRLPSYPASYRLFAYIAAPPRLLHTISHLAARKRSSSLKIHPNGSKLWSIHLFSSDAGEVIQASPRSLHQPAGLHHPLLADLNAHIATVRSLTHSSLTASLNQIHALHFSIADLLLLQDPQNALRGGVAAESLLDAFLILADARQGFQEVLLELKPAVAEATTALRRGDAARASSAARSQRRVEKELSRLAASVSAVSSKCARLNIVASSGEDADMASALMEATSASATASAAVFSGAASMSSSSTTSSCKKMISTFGSFGKKSTPETAEGAIERLEALEQYFDECDGVSDKVFRSIV